MNFPESVHFLLEHEIDLSGKDLYGNTVCDIAKILEHNTILQTLQDHASKKEETHSWINIILLRPSS